MPWALAGAVVGAGASIYASDQAADTQAAAAQQASEDARFKPYSVSNRFGSTRYITPEVAAANVALMQSKGLQASQQPDGTMGFIDPETGSFYNTEARVINRVNQDIQKGTDANLQIGNNSLRQSMERSQLTPEQLAKDRYAQYQEYIKPTRAMEFDKMMGGLALSGQAGYTNGSTGTNPVIESFAKGIAREDSMNYYRAIDEEQALTDTLATRGNKAYAGASAINGLSEQGVEQGAALGGRSAGAASRAGEFAVAGANAQAEGMRTAGNAAGAFFSNVGQNQGVQNKLGEFFGGSLKPFVNPEGFTNGQTDFGAYL